MPCIWDGLISQPCESNNQPGRNVRTSRLIVAIDSLMIVWQTCEPKGSTISSLKLQVVVKEHQSRLQPGAREEKVLRV